MKYSSCVYLVKDEQWLFLKRNKKKNDVNHNKYIGVGGKIEENETMEQCARREVFEETGMHVHTLEHYGTIRFHYPHFEDEICEIYLSYDFSGTIHSCDEGELVWIPQDQIFTLDLWEGDILFLKKMLRKEHFDFDLTYDASDRLIQCVENTV